MSLKRKLPYILKKCLMIIVVIIFFMTVMENKYTPKEAKNLNRSEHKLPHGFLVWSPACKIPKSNPFSKEVLEIYKKLEYENCTNKQPLTKIKQNFVNDTVIVEFHEHLLPRFLTEVQCCYYEVFRKGRGRNADNKFRLSNCTNFNNSFELPASTEFILVECEGKRLRMKNFRQIYTNAHALIRRKEIRSKVASMKILKKNEKPISVLMLGIDSVSRLNLLRAMPETAEHLKITGWFELQGYNKMGRNTFPNFMAILAGLNEVQSKKTCNPKILRKINSCKLIWETFKENGYATGFAEDNTALNTFNYNGVGFLKPPTDHYFRPFGLAAEKYLKTKQNSLSTVCLGYQNYVDHLYQYAIDFAKIYQNQSYFGLFWTSTFSHEGLNDPSMMDLKIKSYLERLKDEGILNSSIVMFFSDHGLRFGPIRNLKTGWLEDRLPFFFISLPKWFQKDHPEIVKNLRINKNRLTSPYDIHMTLQHILEISGIKNNLTTAVGCPKCQSIFKKIPWKRSCEDAGIDGHWCTCKSFKYIEKSTPNVIKTVQYVIDRINFDLKNLIDTKTCAKLELNEILSAKVSKLGEISTDYVVLFDTSPANASFEATVRFIQREKNEKFQMLGPVSRTNRYGDQSYCIDDVVLKLFCYCRVKKS